MLRLTEIKLPLNHDESAINAAIIAKLNIKPEQLLSVHVFKRGFDARKKSDIQLIYTLDIETDNEAALLSKFAKDPHVKPAPDTSYKFVATAPANLSERPIVIGLGPCGLFAGL
ncbi:MAG: putative FAD-dependent dehydrogenase, partial [Rheinheimera aquimaris]